MSQPSSTSFPVAATDVGTATQTHGWRTFSDSLRDEPGSALLSFNHVEALERERNYPVALSLLDELAGEFPGNPLLLVKRGNLRLAAGLPLEAKKDFDLVLKQGKPVPDAMYGLVRVHEYLQDWESALAVCRVILEHDPGNAFAVLHAGWAAYGMKRFDEALAWYSDKRLSGRRAMCLGRGWTLIRLNDPVGARRAFEEITDLVPGDPEALAGIRELERIQLDGRLAASPSLDLIPQLREQGRLVEALQLADAVLANEPESVAALSARARLLSNTGSWVEAEKAYSLLCKKDSNPEFLRGHLAALHALGRLHEAAVRAAEVLRNSPQDPLAVKVTADDLYAVGEFGQALAWYDRLPAGEWSLQGKGWCHLILGNLPEARQAFRELLLRSPGNLSALEGLRRTDEKFNVPQRR